MNDIIENIAFAWRRAVKNPAISALIVLTFAIGLGANSAMFSMAYNILLSPLPYADSDRLVRLEQHEPNAGRQNFPSSVQSYFDFREQNESFEHVLEYHAMQFTLLGHGLPIRVQTGVTSWNYFDVLGIQPLHGRLFVAGEDDIGAEPLILLSHRFWTSQFDSDPDVVGSSLEMNNAIHRVIGVLPPVPAFPDDNDIWITSASCPFRSSPPVIDNRNVPMIASIFAKLRDDVSIENGASDVNGIAQRLLTAYPDSYSAARGYSADLTALKEVMTGDSSRVFYLLIAVSALVLLIACANIANLNLARLASRHQELAVREAVGAKPSAISRQLLIESVLYAMVGGTLGLIVAYFSLGVLSEFAAGYTSLASEIRMDSGTLLFSAVLAVVTGIVSGSAAAFQRRNISRALKEGGDKVTTTASGKLQRSALLAVQLALSFVILTVTALIVLSMYRLTSTDPGYDPENVLNVSLDLNFTNYSSPQEIRDFGQRLLRETSQIAGVESVGVSAVAPGQGGVLGVVAFEIEGRVSADDDVRPSATNSTVSSGYFRTLGIPLVKGETFAESDDENAIPVAVINQRFEETYFPGGNAIGNRISTDQGESWVEIIGVVGDVRFGSPDVTQGPAFYEHFPQRPGTSMEFVLRSAGDLAELGSIVAETIYSIDSQQAVDEIATMNQIRSQWLEAPRLVAILMGLFGVLSLLVTVSGVVGVVSYNVSQRIREIGVHIAVGANPAKIRGIFVRQTVRLLVAGLAIGALAMAFVAPGLSEFLFETSVAEIDVYLFTAFLLAVVAWLATTVPARKASGLNPAAALRNE